MDTCQFHNFVTVIVLTYILPLRAIADVGSDVCLTVVEVDTSLCSYELEPSMVLPTCLPEAQFVVDCSPDLFAGRAARG